MTQAQKRAHESMILCQMLPNEVTSKAVIAAFRAVQREHYVPPAFAETAFADDNIPLTPNRVMMKPFVLARLIQMLELKKSDKILHVAAGRGYASAILAHLCKQVIAVESHHELVEAARLALHHDHLENVEVFASALAVGYPLAAPYDAIFIEGAVQQLPLGLLDQLKDGGRLVTVQNIHQRLDAPSGLGKALFVSKIQGKPQQVLGFDASIPLLAEFEKKSEFVL
jgi:protein-L-isoaspartate(D-aspartate) O-methyltransferase